MGNRIPWDNIFASEPEDSTQNVASIMADYCESIKKETNGVVNARFEVLELAKRPASGLAAFSMAFDTSEEVYQANALPQEDINRLYDSATYVFDVYNETYQFRLCKLVYGARYPVEITMDEGIEEELRKELHNKYKRNSQDGAYIVTNDDELEDCFLLMFTSQKARYILGQLRKGWA